MGARIMDMPGEGGMEGKDDRQDPDKMDMTEDSVSKFSNFFSNDPESTLVFHRRRIWDGQTKSQNDGHHSLLHGAKYHLSFILSN